MKRIDAWNEIPQNEIDSWNERLLKTGASYRQYPFWNEPYKISHFSPRYLIYGGKENPSAYTCVVTIGVGKFRIGLVQCGPVSLCEDREIDLPALSSLAHWAKQRGYVFLRFTHSDKDMLSNLASVGQVEEIEPFPFHRDPKNKLLVEQSSDDDQVLASFQNVARYEIRAAVRAGYEIRVSDRPEDLAEVWPMFEALAQRKRFSLSPRPLAGWIEVFRLAQRHGCARLYSAYFEENLIQSIFVLKYGTTAEYMLGALDIERLQKRVSPSCLIHWRAMRDFYELGCQYYNLGGPGNINQVYQFKRKFHPVLSVNQPPVTLVINQRLYRLWSRLTLRTFLPWRSRARRLISRLQTYWERDPETFLAAK